MKSGAISLAIVAILAGSAAYAEGSATTGGGPTLASLSGPAKNTATFYDNILSTTRLIQPIDTRKAHDGDRFWYALGYGTVDARLATYGLTVTQPKSGDDSFIKDTSTNTNITR